MDIVVVNYHAGWPKQFCAEAACVREILGSNLVQIFHIGSTAVPGLRAKPVIDMMPVVRSLDGVDGCTAAFEALGYEVLGEYGMAGRRYMRKGGDERTHQMHVFRYDNTKDILRHLAFRDYLKSHAEVRAEYGELKSRLAKRYPKDIVAYGDGKEELVKKVERDALQWVWERYGKA